MKILIFISQIHRPNGAEKLAIELAEGLNARKGIRADLLSMYSDRLEGVSEAADALRRRGVERVDFLGMPVQAGFREVIRAIWKLRSFIRQGAYDVVESSLIGPSTLSSWATLGAPCHHLVGIHASIRKDLFTSRKHRLWRFSVRRNRKTRFYSISKKSVEAWLDFSGTPANKTRLVYNSIHADFFAAQTDREGVRKEFGIPPQDRIALFVGRVVKSKGVDTVLEALGPILKTENLHLLYIGDEFASEGFYPDEAGLVDRMKRRIAEEGWTDRVRFVGRRSDVPRLMASSDVLVHPARLEGFGLVLAEAMAAGLPVAASDVDGIPETLAGSDSRRVPPEAPDLLRQAVVEILHLSEELRQESIARGRMTAERYRPDRRIDNLIQLFEDLLAGRF